MADGGTSTRIKIGTLEAELRNNSKINSELKDAVKELTIQVSELRLGDRTFPQCRVNEMRIDCIEESMSSTKATQAKLILAFVGCVITLIVKHYWDKLAS